MKSVKIIVLCTALVAVTGLQAQNMTRAEYIERYKDTAVAHMEKYGIPASIKMAQGLLESNNGNSRLAVEACNHFGIKCKSDWTGLTVYHDDDELGECFRRYSNAGDSWADHSEFLDTGTRYQSLFTLDPLDYKGWAHGLKAAGYATNPRYAELLITIIEDNQLYLLDRGEGLPIRTIIAREDAAAQSPYIELVSPGQIEIDRFTIAMNNVDGREIFRTPDGLFIVAKEGDTIGSLSKLVGVRAKRLARRNRLNVASRLVPGQQINLQ